MKNTTVVSTVKEVLESMMEMSIAPTVDTSAVKRTVVTAKGFTDLGEKGVENLVKVSKDFLATGKLIWAFSDYMKITGAGKTGKKHDDFMKQLSDNSDLACTRELTELIPQIILKMSDPSFALQIDSAALRLHFAPLLKTRSEAVVAAVDDSITI